MRCFNRASAFSLVEIIVVLAILLMLSIPGIYMQQKLASATKTKQLLSKFEIIEEALRAQYQILLHERQLGNAYPSAYLFAPAGTSDTGAATQTFAYPPLSEATDGPGSRGKILISSASNFFEHFSSLTPPSSYAVDPWQHPILIGVNSPRFPQPTLDFSVPFQTNSFCPSRDFSSLQVVFISAGANGHFDIGPGYTTPYTTLHEYVLSAFDSTAGDAVRWNPDWPDYGGGTSDDIIYRIDLSSLDSELVDTTANKLLSLEALLKNHFFSSFYTEMTTQEYAKYRDATDVNFFLSSMLCPMLGLDSGQAVTLTENPIEQLRQLFHLTTPEVTDAWGNLLYWDPSVSGVFSSAGVTSCQDHSVPFSKIPPIESTGGTELHAPFSSRIYSPCAFSKTSSFSSLDNSISVSAQLRNPLLIKTITGTY